MTHIVFAMELGALTLENSPLMTMILFLSYYHSVLWGKLMAPPAPEDGL